ncbi:MAG: hypothetical protein V1860_04405 [bacterium]
MIQIQTTKDIMYLVISVFVLFFTIFGVWLFHYLIKIARDAAKVVEKVEDKVEKAGKVIDLAKEKIDNSAGHFILVVQTIKELVKFIIERREKRQEKKAQKTMRK